MFYLYIMELRPLFIELDEKLEVGEEFVREVSKLLSEPEEKELKNIYKWDIQYPTHADIIKRQMKDYKK